MGPSDVYLDVIWLWMGLKQDQSSLAAASLTQKPFERPIGGTQKVTGPSGEWVYCGFYGNGMGVVGKKTVPTYHKGTPVIRRYLPPVL